jgi:hypothetical protein
MILLGAFELECKLRTVSGELGCVLKRKLRARGKKPSLTKTQDGSGAQWGTVSFRGE